LGQYFGVDGKQLQVQYKDHLSDYHTWDQMSHAEDWIVFPQNIGPFLTIDETSLSQGELYTVITNKLAKGKKGTIVAMVKGTQAEDVIKTLSKIPLKSRNTVKEVTMDMAPSMMKIVMSSFPNAVRVTDRFHVQQLAFDAVQEIRIKYRWQTIEEENQLIALAKKQDLLYQPEILSNGDTPKQLLARSRYLLFKCNTKWTASQAQRAEILFERYPRIKEAYELSMKLGYIFDKTYDKGIAYTRLAQWYDKVEKYGLESFGTVARSIQLNYVTILNFFNNRSTNAAAESFNAKIKAFRAVSRGVRDVNFFLYRLAKIYA
jgi:transposase